MKKDCLDIGTIQAFLDGELASDLLENVLHHFDSCDSCALQLETAEEESAMVFSALEQEFNTLVPTHRLWTKINDEIKREKKSFWQTAFAFFKNPAIASFASLLIVFGVFMAYMNLQDNQKSVANVPEIQEDTIAATSNSSTVNQVSSVEPVPTVKREIPETRIVTTEQNRKNFQVVNANVVSNKQGSVTRTSPNQNFTTQTVAYQYLPGEESYIKTIATLEKTVNTTKDEALNPSARFTYEQNLAVVNDAITKMRTEVKKNPRNESARQILMSSYQNKVDLLNSVAEKNQLMASMK